MVEDNEGSLTFENCTFNINASAGVYTSGTTGRVAFNKCTFEGAFRYPIYARAKDVEVTGCTYNSTLTDVVAGLDLNAHNMNSGKVVFTNNTLSNGDNIDLSTGILFHSTNNINGAWDGPVEFNVQGNTGFAQSYEKYNSKINASDHTFAEGSDTF